jgi:hypothetical protein
VVRIVSNSLRFVNVIDLLLSKREPGRRRCPGEVKRHLHGN